jgi:hypothetical protein
MASHLVEFVAVGVLIHNEAPTREADQSDVDAELRR